jgi:hypothetical protein
MYGPEHALIRSLDALGNLLGLHGGCLPPKIEERCLALVRTQQKLARGRIDRMTLARSAVHRRKIHLRTVRLKRE